MIMQDIPCMIMHSALQACSRSLVMHDDYNVLQA